MMGTNDSTTGLEETSAPGNELTLSGRVKDLCARIRRIAQLTGEETLCARQQQAEQLRQQSRQQAQAECQALRLKAQRQMESRLGRELQNARLEARVRIAHARWTELDGVLAEAEQFIHRLRREDPARYAAALVRCFQLVSSQLNGSHLIVEGSAADIRLLREALPSGFIATVDFREAELSPGIRVSTSEGNVFADQTWASRRQRLEQELRLQAAEVLFAEET